MDATWAALPGERASDMRLLTNRSQAEVKTVQPMSVSSSIAAKNLHLMALAQKHQEHNKTTVRIPLLRALHFLQRCEIISAVLQQH